MVGDEARGGGQVPFRDSHGRGDGIKCEGGPWEGGV